LEDYGREALSAEDRREVRGHLSACAACRAQAAAADPVLLFAAAPAEAVSPEDVASVLSSVRAGIALRQAERRIEGGSGPRPAVRGRGARAAAAAAVVLLTLVVPSGLRSPAEAPPAAPAGGPTAAAVSPVAAPEATVKTSGGATVYDWNPGAGEPRVVWIVDGSIDI
jgi:hypothetical protein